MIISYHICEVNTMLFGRGYKYFFCYAQQPLEGQHKKRQALFKSYPSSVPLFKVCLQKLNLFFVMGHMSLIDHVLVSLVPLCRTGCKCIA